MVELYHSGVPSLTEIGLSSCRGHRNYVLPATQAAIMAQPQASPAKRIICQGGAYYVSASAGAQQPPGLAYLRFAI